MTTRRMWSSADPCALVRSEAEAWDRYVLALLPIMIQELISSGWYGTGKDDIQALLCQAAGVVADNMLSERRKRFGT